MQYQVIAASKTQPLSAVLAVFKAGITQFGENRVEEAAGKITLLPQTIRAQTTWHMIGHVQSRKVKQAVEIFDWIQSIDSLQLAEKINRHALSLNKIIPILVQVNISDEQSKSGYELAHWQKNPLLYENFAQELLHIHLLPSIRLKGFMTIAPASPNSADARPHFRSLRLLKEKLQKDFPQLTLSELSMGMSHDHLVAIEEGATMIRLGRALFGERKS